jgi:hypothetical protein
MRARHMLFTNNVHINRGAPTKDYIKVATSHCQPDKLEGIRVQFGIEDRVLRISYTHLSNYLRTNDIQPQKVVDQLKTLFGAHVGNGRLGAGLPRFTGLGEQVITINTKGTELDFEA